MHENQAACPLCGSINNYINNNINFYICNYCFLAFKSATDSDKKLENKLNTQIFNLKSNIVKVTNRLQISIGYPIFESDIQIPFNDLDDVKKLNHIIYQFVNEHKLIKNILFTSINNTNIDILLKYRKFFDPKINIWILNPSIKFACDNASEYKYIYSIYSINKKMSQNGMDIFDLIRLSDDYNLIKICNNSSEDKKTIIKIEDYANREIQFKKFNPNISL